MRVILIPICPGPLLSLFFLCVCVFVYQLLCFAIQLSGLMLLDYIEVLQSNESIFQLFGENLGTVIVQTWHDLIMSLNLKGDIQSK